MNAHTPTSKIIFKKTHDNSFKVYNKRGELLGVIIWYDVWNCHVWFQAFVIMSSECLSDIERKLEQLDTRKARAEGRE